MSVGIHSLPRTEPDNSDGGTSLLAPRVDWAEMGQCEHFVQFYEDDGFLMDSVSSFLGAGLKTGDAALVIATKPHREALEQRFQKAGLNAVDLADRYLSLDAAETLSKFMVNGRLEEKIFLQVIDGIVIRATQSGRNLRIFGEMVALLWAEGNRAETIRVEELWNELGKGHSFSIFCAYPIHGFRGEANGQTLMHVCQEHSRVIPAESFGTEKNLDERLRTIIRLQQKASSLEAEIAERKRAESATRAEQAKLAMAADVASLGIWELDGETNLLTCSEHCKAHFGLAPDEPLTYETFIQLIHPEDRERVQATLQALPSPGSERKSECRVVDSSGGLRWIVLMGRRSRDDGKRTMGVTLNLTERKRAAEILERTVIERTAQLQEMVAELEAFSYSVSHDLRAPLRAMQGYAKALVEDYGPSWDPAAVKYLERIDRASARLELLITDILAYSKVVNGRVELQAVSLGPLIEDILEHRPDFESMRHHISVEKPLHAVLGQEAYLTQCITNLISNALKFVAPGVTPEVRIRSEEVGDKVRVWIRDNGVGIPPEHQGSIFQLFGRVHPAKCYEGNGLGLAIVKRAVARMGGEAGFQSTIGRGSDFWFTLKKA